MREPTVRNKLSRTWTLTGQFELLVWASLSVPTGRGKSLCYAILSYVQTNLTWKTALSISVWGRTLQSNKTKHRLHTEPDETRWCGTASQHPELVKPTSTKPYTYTSIEHDNIKLAFRLYNSKFREPKRNRQVPRLFFPFGRMKSLACETRRGVGVKCDKWYMSQVRAVY